MSPTKTFSVLIIEDESDLAVMMATYLTQAGFNVLSAGDGPEAIQQARQHDPDVILLDLGLPGMDGIEVCRQLRTFTDCYIVIVTARNDEVDTLVGLSVGADDYVTKPFRIRELLARVQTVLRRPRVTHSREPLPPDDHSDIREYGELRINITGREVHVGDKPITMTRTEFDLLAALSSRPTAVFTRRQLLDEIWGAHWVGDEHLVDTHIAHVRRKIGDDPVAAKYIRTVRGVGYRMGEG